MRARRLGTDSPFVEIDKIQLKDKDILYSAEVMEFELHPEDCIKSKYPNEYWDKLKHQAAIAAMQGTINILSNNDRCAFAEIIADNYTGKEKTYPNEIAEFATACAESLIEKLKGE